MWLQADPFSEHLLSLAASIQCAFCNQIINNHCVTSRSNVKDEGLTFLIHFRAEKFRDLILNLFQVVNCRGSKIIQFCVENVLFPLKIHKKMTNFSDHGLKSLQVIGKSAWALDIAEINKK